MTCLTVFSDLDKNVNACKFLFSAKASLGCTIRPQALQFSSIAMNQVPLQKEIHAVTVGIGRMNVGCQEKTAGGEHIVQNIHKSFANTIRQIVKESSTIDKIIPLVGNLFARFPKHLMDRFLDHLTRGSASVLIFGFFEHLSRMLNRFFVEV